MQELAHQTHAVRGGSLRCVAFACAWAPRGLQRQRQKARAATTAGGAARCAGPRCSSALAPIVSLIGGCDRLRSNQKQSEAIRSNQTPHSLGVATISAFPTWGSSTHVPLPGSKTKSWQPALMPHLRESRAGGVSNRGASGTAMAEGGHGDVGRSHMLQHSSLLAAVRSV